MTTFFFWPILCNLSKACCSTIGFHWGSMRYTRDAAVRLSLCFMSACIYLRKEGHIYPTAPLPIDIKRIFTFGSPRNRSMDSFRCCRESRPSNRVNLIFWESSANPIKSNILVQQEKTTLKVMINFWLSWIGREHFTSSLARYSHPVESGGRAPGRGLLLIVQYLLYPPETCYLSALSHTNGGLSPHRLGNRVQFV